jgi:hypothetical protein
MKPQILTKEQSTMDDLSHEALQILEILDQIESHTAVLRTKLMNELKSKSETINVKLEELK